MEFEIGRELKGSDLKPKTVVIVLPPGNKSLHISVSVKSVEKTKVVFYSGDLGMHILNFIQPDGSITDDVGRVVHVYEYLGKV